MICRDGFDALAVYGQGRPIVLAPVCFHDVAIIKGKCRTQCIPIVTCVAARGDNLLFCYKTKG